MGISESHTTRIRLSRMPLLLLSGYALLTGSWLVSNPAGAAPDESSHYVKALGVARGQWSGARPERLPAQVAALPGFGVEAYREFTIPGSRWSPGFNCILEHPADSAGCQLQARPESHDRLIKGSVVGTWQPYLYLASGLVAGVPPGPMNGMRAARLIQALLNLALLSLAIFALWDEDNPGESLLGLVIATTPMIVFIGASLNPSGPEIYSGLCLAAGLLRTMRSSGTSRLGWVATGAGASIMGLGRPTGPLWLLVLGLWIVALMGSRAAWNLIRAGGRRSATALGVTALAVASNLIWEFLVVEPPLVRFPSEMASFSSSFAELRGTFRHLVGVFGWLDVVMPYLAYVVWFALLVVVVLLGWLVGSRRHRLALILLTGGSFLIAGCLSAFWLRRWGIGMQGRYFLPLLVSVPLLAGEIIRSGHTRLTGLWPRRMGAWVAIVVAAIQLVAWYSNSRRYAVGLSGPVFFFGREEWTPPWGYLPWAVTACLGCLCVALFGILTTRNRTDSALLQP